MRQPDGDRLTLRPSYTMFGQIDDTMTPEEVKVRTEAFAVEKRAQAMEEGLVNEEVEGTKNYFGPVGGKIKHAKADHHRHERERGLEHRTKCLSGRWVLRGGGCAATMRCCRCTPFCPARSLRATCSAA